MRIVEDKALLLKVRNPNRILTTIPQSERIGTHKVLVPWSIPHAHRLRDLGISAPSPISRQYKWPGQYKPYKHQITTASFLTLHPRAFCFNEQGTGKTASAIWAADYLMKQGLVNRVLIICPLSIMDSAWRADLFTVAMHRTVDIAHGAAAKRKRIINGPAEFIIINYDGVDVVKEEIANGGFDLIIVDEATHYKTATTKRWKALKYLVKDNTWLWLMTGTPAAQSPLDAYGLAKLVNPEGVPRFFGTFRDLVMVKVSRFRWVPKEDSTEKVHRALQPAIRYTKEDCLDLPDMVYTMRDIEMTAQQRKYYNELRKEMLIEAQGAEVTAATAAVKMNKLLQISCGAVYTDDHQTLLFDIRSKYNVLKEVIDETSNKVLVFVPFKHTLERLKAVLDKDSITNEIISGAVKAHDRATIFKSFQQNKHPRVLLIQPQAAAHGVTLTAADTVVWWAPTTSHESFAQANARVHRSGQTNKCTVVQLSSSPVERRLYSLLGTRVIMHQELVKLYHEALDSDA